MPARDFESIYADYSRMVYWAAYGVLKNENDAMDASQNVFLRVMKHQKKLETMEDAQLKSWLYRVTVNLCLDGKRKLKREVLADELPEMPVSDVSVLPEAAALDAETREALHRALRELPEINAAFFLRASLLRDCKAYGRERGNGKIKNVQGEGASSRPVERGCAAWLTRLTH